MYKKDVNNQKQANEAGIILDALIEASSTWETTTTTTPQKSESLEVVCGDFNSNSCGLGASLAES